jgi:hypothetical protein
MNDSLRLTALAVAMSMAAVLCRAEDAAAAPPSSPAPKDAIEKARGKVTEALFGFQPSFFGDGLTTYDDGGHRHFDWNALELDLSKDFHEDLQASAAFVQTHDSAKMTVGFLDWHPFGGMVSPRGRLWVEKGFHVQAGRFDVPFGNDWQFFASKDSVSISRPLTTTDIMAGGYNDAGIRALGNNGTLNFNVFLLRGFSRGDLAGGRIGLTPFGNPFSLKGLRDPKTAEFGISYFYDADRNGRKAGWGSAVDAELRLDDWTLRGEYLTRHQEPTDTEVRTSRHGWHLTQEYAFGGALPTLFARYERATLPSVGGLAGGPQNEPTTRVALGLSATQWGFVQFKLEGQRNLQAPTSTSDAPGYSQTRWYAQIVLVL